MAGFGRGCGWGGDARGLRDCRRRGGWWRGSRRRGDRRTVRVGCGEWLEARVLLTGVFADALDVTVLAPTDVSLDTPVDGVWNGGQIEVIGAEGGQAALERFSLSTGSEGIVLFESLASAAGGSGDPSGTLCDGAVTPDGVLYVGQSAGSISPAQPTS